MTKQLRDDLEQGFYVVSVLVVMIGGIIWLAALNFQSQSNADDLKQMKVKSEEVSREFEEIRVRLTHIEDAINRKR